MNRIFAHWLLLAALLLFGQGSAALCEIDHVVLDHAADESGSEHAHEGQCRLCLQLGTGALPLSPGLFAATARHASPISPAVATPRVGIDGFSLPQARAPPLRA